MDLTPEQRAIVEAEDGPVVVIAGAGTGKTRVIVERVRWLLETKGDLRGGMTAEPTPRHGDPFGGPLAPEQILVLTYNVKATRELQERLDEAVGPAVRARITVSNFHSFCQHVLTESAGDAGLPARPDVLDGVGQLLLLRDLRHTLDLRYHSDWSFPGFVQLINRAKDELVGPDDFGRFVEAEQQEYERRYGPWAGAPQRLETQGNLAPLRAVRGAYSGLRANERARAEASGEARTYEPSMVEKVADREARRTVGGDGYARSRHQFGAEDLARIDTLTADYERDGAALEIVRLEELVRVYRAYERELGDRGALDFGEQIALVARLFKTRPNVLRRWQRQFRYILVDEFQDANVAQIELIELLGRTPDRPDNVMVVGDDDQSIYRFRGASFAAFAEFQERFGAPPAHALEAAPPGPPRRLRIDQNFRSTRHIIDAANRLIECNVTRFEPDKRLWTARVAGLPVELHVCASVEDEAVAIVDEIREHAGPDASDGTGEGRRWNDVAVLYRKHKHRDAIVDRLRAEDIPYTVVGGLSLFEAPEIRDLEQGLRAIADPHDDAAIVRMMTAGPWRMDALEILRVARDARFDRSRLVDAAQRMVEQGQEHEDVLDEDTGEARAPWRELATVPSTLRAKLRMLLGAIEELNPLTWREGPYTILERYLERTGVVLDLLAAGTIEARRSVVNIGSFMRFASDWQAANPTRTLADFVDYLDAYKAAGGELPTSVELTEDVDGVRLMTLYQAKGLEFPVVIVPNLLEGEWPARVQGAGWFPRELLREAVPTGDIHTDEERRLLYVAMTRAQERLILTSPAENEGKAPSRFVGELRNGAGEELTVVDRTESAGSGPGALPATASTLPSAGELPTVGTLPSAGELRSAGELPTAGEAPPLGESPTAGESPTGSTVRSDEQLPRSPVGSFAGTTSQPTNWPVGEANVPRGEPLVRPANGGVVPGDPARTADSVSEALATARRVMPLPTARERRLASRLRAAELVGLMEATVATDPEAEGARDAFAAQLAEIGRGAAAVADQARDAGLDPLTFRHVALDTAAGSSLLDVAPVPGHFSYSALNAFERCGLAYALEYVYRIPEPARPQAPLTFGSTAHAAFEAFTSERRERIARGEPAPTREDLERLFAANWQPSGFGDRTEEQAFGRRVGPAPGQLLERRARVGGGGAIGGAEL